MFDIDNFGIIGGDKRQLALACGLLEDGFKVFVAGFESVDSLPPGCSSMNFQQLARRSDRIILPVPLTKDNIHLHAPHSREPIPLDESFAAALSMKKVYCSMSMVLLNTSSLWTNADVYNYADREDFAIKNAVPTAEGAIEIAMRKYPSTIHGSKCLVTGFGRIGKVLSRMLSGLGADVTVSARRPSDIAWIQAAGFKAILTANILQTPFHHYNLIFNTIPKMIFDHQTLKEISPRAIIIDLSSAPGGIDFEAASDLGITTIKGFGLPGKVAPVAAGSIIKETIYNIIKEEG